MHLIVTLRRIRKYMSSFKFSSTVNLKPKEVKQDLSFQKFYKVIHKLINLVNTHLQSEQSIKANYISSALVSFNSYYFFDRYIYRFDLSLKPLNFAKNGWHVKNAIVNTSFTLFPFHFKYASLRREHSFQISPVLFRRCKLLRHFSYLYK